jgi:two-component system, NarL family, sensor histidine kinase UhpB
MHKQGTAASIMRPQDAWHRQPIRTQLLLAVAFINVIAGIVAGGISIANTRSSTQAEIESSLEIAQRFVAATIKDLRSQGHLERLAEMLPPELNHLRHVRIVMMDSFGKLTLLLSKPEAERDQSVPAWFAYLVRPHTAERRVRVVSTDHANPVLIIGEPADEIAEHWENFRWLALDWIAFELILLLILAVVMGRILNPLKNLAGGMLKLEDGDYAARLEPPKVKELAVLTDRFNALANALEVARGENRQLNAQLISSQDSERKEIADELHDEAGPCLFGITANASSIKKAATSWEDAEPLPDVILRADQILKITERLKHMNRSLLGRLTPTSRDHAAQLADLIDGLICDFEQAHPGTSINRQLDPLAKTYGRGVDLTVQRALQEGVTNAIRHGRASVVTVHLSERRRKRAGGKAEAASTLELILTDNGNGMVDSARRGFGLTTMSERVRALGGTCQVVGIPSEGTSITIRIPLAKHATDKVPVTETAA